MSRSGITIVGLMKKEPFFLRKICARLKKPLRYNLTFIKNRPTGQSS
jgi:hypothetical protein